MRRRFQCKAIPSSWLETEGRRLDCGPYMSGAIEARELLKKHRTVSLQNLCHDIYHTGREGRTYVVSAEHGVPFMGSTDILAADLSYLPYISKKQVAMTPKFILGEGWTLITRSGTIGRMAYARSEMDGLACSEHVMRVVPKESKIRQGYLYAYLSSKFGIPLVVSGTYGSIVQSIEPHHIADLPVPRLGELETRVHDFIQQAADLLTQYQANINDATKLFFESVGLEDISAAQWHSWGSDTGFLTTIKGIESIRAVNFNPRFLKICDRMKQGHWKPLDEICPASLKRGGRYRRIDAEPEHSYLMVGQKQIFWLRPEGRWIARTCVNDEVIVEPGTTLIAGAGTLGESELYSRCEFIWGEAVKRAYSELFYRAMPDETIMLKGALFAFLRSETAFRMLRSISYGSKLQYPHRDFLPNLPVPYPNKSTQKKINALIIDGYEKKDRAIQLEDEARTLVEHAIEEGCR